MGLNEQIEAAIEATAFHSPTTYSWFGAMSPPLDASVRRELTPQIERRYLTYNLQSQLYRDFYCAGSATPATHEVIDLQVVGMTPFVRQLSEANTGSGSCEDGWQVCMIEDTTLVVGRAGLELWVRREDCVMSRRRRIAPGMDLALRFPKELLSMSPGFYVALSDEVLTEADSQRLVRFYWNLTPDGAVRFMRRATQALNRSRLAFRLKVVNDPLRFTRCDAVVLYVRRVDYPGVSEIMERLYREVATGLKRGEPVFTKRLAAGLGLAEDPGRGESFGFHRCGALAEGMVRAHEQRLTSTRDRLRVVQEAFEHCGISPSRPFLSSGAPDPYRFGPAARRTRAAGPVVPSAAGEDALLQTAAEIGRRLCRSAVWHDRRCNWMGHAVTESEARQRALVVKYGALGPDLYAGTSGISLFLASLYAATGEREFRRTALGAMHQALSRVDAVSPAARLGLYSGWTGIGFAAACVGRSVHDDELPGRATQLLRRLASTRRDDDAFDFVSGQAGAVAALVVLRDVLDDRSLLEHAVRLGDALLRSAEGSAFGDSWRSPRDRRHHNLTGFAHGTAGVAHALLALFEATGAASYARGAEQAFRYERQWFDAEASNWPDLRDVPRRRSRAAQVRGFSATWCHGAPGIALSRLRACEVLQDATYRAEAVAGLEATRRVVERWLDSGTGNFSLCHGLSGNAEILLHGAHVLGPEHAGGAALARAVASAGIARGTHAGGRWPCGVAGGETPGLMLGLAGIGYFYLRLRDPSTRSVLSLVAAHRA